MRAGPLVLDADVADDAGRAAHDLGQVVPERLGAALDGERLDDRRLGRLADDDQVAALDERRPVGGHDVDDLDGPLDGHAARDREVEAVQAERAVQGRERVAVQVHVAPERVAHAGRVAPELVAQAPRDDALGEPAQVRPLGVERAVDDDRQRGAEPGHARGPDRLVGHGRGGVGRLVVGLERGAEVGVLPRLVARRRQAPALERLAGLVAEVVERVRRAVAGERARERVGRVLEEAGLLFEVDHGVGDG